MQIPTYDTLASMLTGRTGLFIVLLFGGLFFYLGCYRAVTLPAGDFASYYTSSRLVLDGTFKKADVYDYYNFEKSTENYFNRTLSSFLPLPPSTALMLIPLAWLPPEPARVVFMLINVACLVLLIWMLRRLTRLSLPVLVSVILLSGISLWSDVREGQVYLLLTVLIVAALVLERDGKRFAAGLLLGLALPVKYFTLLFVIYFLFRKRYRLVIGAAAAALAVFGAGLIAGGLKMNLYYLSVILPRHLAGSIQNPFTVHFQSFDSLFNRIFIPNGTLNPHPILDAPFLGMWLRSFVPLLAVSLLVAAIFELRHTPEHERTLYSAAVLVLFGLAVSPASATYHLTLLIVPMTILFALTAEEILHDDMYFIRKRLPIMFGVYLAITLVPFYKLYGFKTDPLLQLLSYLRLLLTASFFLLSLPPKIFGTKGFRGLIGAAIVLSILAGYIRLPQKSLGDGAKWAGVHGLIIPRLYRSGDAVFYMRDTRWGYIEKKLEPVTDPDTRPAFNSGSDLEPTVFDSTVGESTQLFVRNNRNGVVARLTGRGLHNTNPVWNADRSRLYFLSDRGRGIDCTTIFYFPASRVRIP